jgi:DnaJ-class molecular chaperone
MTDAYEEQYCGGCAGSGEGMYDGSRCHSCKGSGTEYVLIEQSTNEEGE